MRKYRKQQKRLNFDKRIVQVSCGGTVIQNRTHFLNPMFPQTFNQEMRCQISVSLPSYACQLRLNFVKFLISNPRRSQCVVDALNIPHPYNLPVLCGNLTGQHSMSFKNVLLNKNYHSFEF